MNLSGNEDFINAFQAVLAHDLDRRMVLELARTPGEFGYEELRKAVGETSNQTFNYAFERLMYHVLVYRRLQEQGKYYHSYLSATPRAMLIAKILTSLGKSGRLPASLASPVREQVQAWFAPPVSA